jgi:chaperonin cofactor prefoldin
MFFSDRDYHAYQARQNFLREQLSRQHELDKALQEKEAALAEIERLKALLGPRIS